VRSEGARDALERSRRVADIRIRAVIVVSERQPTYPQRRGRIMADLIFVLLTIGLFAILAAVVRLVERL
jgi:hypothetical protein